MEIFDFAFSFLWEYDEEFIHLLEEEFQKNRLSTFIITDHNIEEVTELVRTRKLHFHIYFDRAWDVDDRFEHLGKALHKRKTLFINSYEKVFHAIDKATMHLELITAGLYVPYSIIIPPHSEREDIFISVSDLARLGRPFIIKPCNTTGGGVGVVTGAESLQEIFSERVTNSDDKYLLQEKIYPRILDGKRAWFRCFWIFDEVIPTWWNDVTHLYQPLTRREINEFKLSKLFNITKAIASVSELEFFSTEIVLSEKDLFVVIDYVNDQCDLRFKSHHKDGVPDEIIRRIISKFRLFVKAHKKKNNLS